MLFAYVVIFSVTGVLIGFGSAESTVGSWHHERARVAVIDRDASPLSSALKEQVLSDNDAQELADDRRAIQDAVAKDSCSYVLVIPQGWGGGLMSAAARGADAPDLETYVSYRSGTGSLVDISAKGYANDLYGLAATLGESQENIVAMAREAAKDNVRMSIVRQQATPLPESLSLSCAFATYPIFEGPVACIAMLMASLNEDGVRARRLVSALSPRRMSVALLALCLLVGLIAWAWVFGLNVLAFASGALVTSSVQLSIVAAALGAYTLFAVAVGFLLGQLEIPENAINGLTNLLGMTLSFLGGAWVSMSYLPDELVAVAHFTPAFWATEAIRGAASMVDVTPERVLPLLANVGVVLLFAAALLVVALAVGKDRARTKL